MPLGAILQTALIGVLQSRNVELGFGPLKIPSGLLRSRATEASSTFSSSAHSQRYSLTDRVNESDLSDRREAIDNNFAELANRESRQTTRRSIRSTEMSMKASRTNQSRNKSVHVVLHR
jgi:hypothetical protein